MNVHAPDLDRMPTRDGAEAELDTLRRWALRVPEAPSIAPEVPQAPLERRWSARGCF